MELFKVICVTCRAKLSVRNEALIGQIVGCPRCGSMVEVAPPPESAAPIAASSESTVTLAAVPAAAATEEVADAPSPEDEPVSSEAIAAALEANAAVAKYKLMTWSLAGISVSAVLVGAVLLTRSAPDAEAEVSSVDSQEATIIETPPEPLASAVNEGPTVVDETIDETSLTSLPAEAPPVPVVEEVPVADVETAPPNDLTPLDSEPAAIEDTVTQPEPRVARRFDPLDFDPENLSLSAVDRPSTTIEPPEATPIEEPAEVAEEVPSTLPLVRRGPQDGDDASQRVAENQLKLTIPALKFDRLPLVDCLRLISQLSGVPVSVTPEQLLMAGITPQKTISLDASDLSLGEMLAQVLEPLRLEYTTRGEQVVIRRRGTDRRREINYPVDDLVMNEFSEAQLASWVERLVAPSTWESAGGVGKLEAAAGSLRVTQSERIQYQVLILLERLRLARDLPPRSRYPVKRLAGTPADALLQDRLAKSVTFTFSQFTALDDIFVHWQTELGAPLLIDWPALAENELWPQTTVACAIIEEPWHVAFEQVLEPLGLGWRATAGGAIEITSAKRAHKQLRLELYPLRQTAEGIVDQLRAAIGEQASDTGGAIFYDATGNAVLSSQPATAQRIVFDQLQQRQLLRSQ